MKKSIWTFLLAVLLPSAVLGWLALRSAEEQQIVFERRTAELYQKETDSLAVTVRDTVDAERRVFGETVHRLLAKGDAEALARDFTNTLADAWGVKAVGFAINRDGKLVSPSVATVSKKPELQRFLLGNGGFLTSTEPAIVYNWAGDNSALRNPKLNEVRGKSFTNQNAGNAYSSAANAGVAGKDVAQHSERAFVANEPGLQGNEVITLGNAAGAISDVTLTFGNQASGIGGLGDAGQIITQPPVNAGATFGLGGTATIVLSGGVQMFCQVPANVSAFDFTGVMSAPDSRNMMGNLNGILPVPGVPSGTSSLALAPQQPGGMQKQEGAVYFSAPAGQSPSLPSPMGAASRADDRLTLDREELPAPGAKFAKKDAPAGGADAKMKTRGIVEGDAVKPKPAAPVAGGDLAKKAANATDELKGGARLDKAMSAERANEPLGRASSAPSPQKPASPAQIELKPTAEMRDQQSQPAPAASLREVTSATKSAKFRAQNFPAAKPQPSTPAPTPTAAAPMPDPAAATPAPAPATKMPPAALRKSDTPQSAQIFSDGNAEQPTLTKSGSGALTLNSSINRLVEPQQLLGQQSAALSTVVPETAEFRSITEEGDDGLVARFVQDKLNLIFWVRPPEAPEMVFGCLVEAGHFSELWKDVLERHQASSRGARAALELKPEFVLALLDDRGKPVAMQPADAGARDWKHPFVASEIGEALPHWEAALYLASPTALAESARGLWRTLAFTIAGAVALIALGGWLVVADARRQLALAQQKTDFVSNVSHELKTPLTSIRMFAELMHDRPQPAEKQGQYLRIITVEAERLTRLINNVLDFAKLGRKQKQFEKKPLDLHEVISRVWESQGLHLREAGFATRWEAAAGPYPILGDDDALAQVLVNLLSNAEKYSTERKEVKLHTWMDDGWVNVSVIDCGMGVPNGEERKIFEAFYRAHDSLSSGIQGSGLGLTLAQRVAREHGGEIKFERRDGGGSRFTLRLPLAGKVGS